MFPALLLIALMFLTWGVAVWASYDDETPGHSEQADGQIERFRQAA
jgi:hypothetical protein